MSPGAGERDYYARMRACATANAVFIGLALAALTFAACSSGQTPSPAPGGAASAAPGEGTGSPAAPSAAPSSAPAGSAAAAPGKPSGPPTSEITNEPNGGVVMNNAMTAGDAGASDRFQPIVDVFKSNRDKFRACFDNWNKTHNGQSGSVYLVLDLRADGSISKISVNATKSTLHAPELEACMIDEAKKFVYPKSPSGKETTFTYPFDFKARY